MIIRSLRNTRRLFTIARILAQEDALFIIDDLEISPALSAICRIFTNKKPGKRKGQRLASAIERLGPTFIKLGQALSTRSDLIGESLADDLAGLRDNLPPFPTVIARQIIEDEFKAPIQSLFLEFNDIPVAAASIAQVHKAVTKDGKIVAVKILRPQIEQAFARDLDLFFWIAEIIERRVRSWRRLKPMQVVQTFKEAVFFELDLRFEAAAASELADNLKRHGDEIKVPAIDWNLTSRRVLTMDWVDSIPFSNIEAIKTSGFDPNVILGKAARSLFSQVFKDGFFHADLHPGNLFLDKNGDLVAVDFGIMGRLDWKSRIYIAEILRGFMQGDYKAVADIHFDAGYVPPNKSRGAFTQACMAVARPITGKPLNEISIAALLGQMFSIAAEFEMEVQPQLLLMQKTMMVAEGVGRMLNPNLNMWELATPLIEDWASENFGLKAKLKNAAENTQEIIQKFPYILDNIENTVKNLGDEKGIRLHPDTIQLINHDKIQRNQSWLFFAWCALVLTFISFLALIMR
jgi:ubiquinone biosynthesis protein